MIVVRNITDKMHEAELKDLIYEYYDDTYGGIFSKIPFKKVRDYFTGNQAFANEDLKDLYDKNTNSKAVGLYEGDTLIGFACIHVHEGNGELYNLYIKPEFRDKFVSEYESGRLTTDLMTSLINEFESGGAGEIVVSAPYTKEFMLKLFDDMGFNLESVTSEEAIYSKNIEGKKDEWGNRSK